MVVKVCDALCGSGKTQGCITMMNEDTESRYIFITPYLDEVERIKNACKGKNFVSPERKFTNGYSKLNDINQLLRAKENIASTHALFGCYTEETQKLIEEGGYTLVLDEVLDLFQPVEYDGNDINFLVRNNIVKKEEDNVIWDDEEYGGVLFSELVQMSKSRNLVDYDGSFFFWSIPIEVFRCFKQVYVLTYLFEYQFLRHFFDINAIQYELIGTKKDGENYRFCDMGEMDRKRDLKSLIHIDQNEKRNSIGKAKFSLSSGWYKAAYKEEEQKKIKELKANLYNSLRDVPAEEKMWTTFNRYRGTLKGKGYSNGFITFNKRATNDFASKHHLAYCVNVFMMPWMRNHLVEKGSTHISQDMYALSVLIQWIFRSAIRKGEEIWLYVPSERMRFLLERWLDNLAKGEDLKEIDFNKDNKRQRRKRERGARGALAQKSKKEVAAK